jgi:HEPN domain-containing protein
MRQHEAWLVKAENDLKSARKLMAGDTPIADTAIYHAQQCAEKSLKAFLAFQQQPIRRTHDIAYLIELCNDFDESFSKLEEDAEILSPYHTAFRYPDIILEPDEEDVLEAIERAERIFEFVKDLIL